MDQSVSSQSAILNTSVVVSNAAPLRIDSVSTEQMFRFSDYLRRCIAEGVDDKRAAVLSQEATVQLHRAFLTKSGGRVPKGATVQLWMAWPTERLATAVEFSFPRAGQSNLDWLHAFDNLFVELDVKDGSSYSVYLNDITKTELNAQHKITPETQVVKTLVANLGKPPKSGTGTITRCNRQMHIELKRLSDEKLVPTIEDFIIEFGGIADRAGKVLQTAVLWDNSQDSKTLSNTRKRADQDIDQSTGKFQKMEHAMCQGCGVVLPAYIDPTKVHQECRRCAGHPDKNVTGRWDKSSTQLILGAKGYHCLSRKHYADGSLLEDSVLEAMRIARLQHPPPQEPSRSATANNPRTTQRDGFKKPGTHNGAPGSQHKKY